MASHTLKMFTSFILVVGCLNLTYYAAYWKYPSKSHDLQKLPTSFNKHDDKKQASSVDENYRDEPKSSISLIKVVLRRGHQRKFQRRTIQVTWSPEYLCGENATNCPEKSSPLSDRRPENLSSNESYETTDTTNFSLCPELPPSLGQTHLEDSVNLDDMARVVGMLENGGWYTPSHCVPTETVAIIVPYKGKETPLILFAYSVHLSVVEQNVAYQMFIITEIDSKKPLYPGLLYNIGFIEAQKMGAFNFTCVVFHDPYIAPRDSRNLYRCSDQPKQLVALVDNWPYKTKIGGAIAMRPEVFQAVNGFSNQYTDSVAVFKDMYYRLIAANYRIVRSSPEHAVYNSLFIEDSKVTVSKSSAVASPVRKRAVTWKKSPMKGLKGLTYLMVYPEQKYMYTMIEVDSSPARSSPARSSPARSSPSRSSPARSSPARSSPARSSPALKTRTSTVSTKSSNPLYDETTTPTTTKPIVTQMKLKARSRVLG